MTNKLVFTHYKDNLMGLIIDEKEQLLEVHPFTSNKSTNVGDIYVGKVMSVKPNIQSAFVDIGEEDNVFVSLANANQVFYAKRHGKTKPVVQDDEILVQIEKDAHKTKLAKAVTDFCLTGKYVVLTTDKPAIFVSSKIIDTDVRNTLKAMAKPFLTKQYGFIMRTNCMDVEETLILEDIKRLTEHYEHIIAILPYRSAKQRLVTHDEPFLSLIRDFNTTDVDALLFDDKAYYTTAVDYLTEHHETAILDKLSLSDSNTIPYSSQLNLNKKIEQLLSKKVWLKSGASLIIEPTEALVSIDVNTEKSNRKTNSEETVFQTNLEAASEIMRQIRARNLSGIIIIDFIDMKKESHKQALMVHLRKHAKLDSLKTVIVDMTPLGLVEITRKKVKPTLNEQLKLL